MSMQDNKTLVHRFWEEIWNQGNMAAADEIVASDFVLYTPGEQIDGPEGLKRWVKTVRGASPDIHFTLDDTVAEGNKVVTSWTGRGTNNGPFAGRPPTGKKITMTGISIFRIENDKIVEDKLAEDSLGFMQQLGVIPPLK